MTNKPKTQESNEPKALVIHGVVNCTTCAFNDQEFIDEICSYCDKYFNKHKPK